jgi:hypothetical protein
MDDAHNSGSCLCGTVRFTAVGPMRPVIACHCTQCRRTSGHYWAASSVPHDRFRLTGEDGLAWFRSSPAARRGFCRRCGASLFWQPEGESTIHFAPGALDGPTGLAVGAHWFAQDGGDYYAPSGPPPPPAAGPGPALLRATCLCGGCRFTLPGPAGDITACHCTQCRKVSGHHAASFDVSEADVVWQARGTLERYRTGGGGTRGFCAACGSSLWFRSAGGGFSVEAGSVEGATGGRLSSHIFVADKGDYYLLDDGLPQFEAAG